MKKLSVCISFIILLVFALGCSKQRHSSEHTVVSDQVYSDVAPNQNLIIGILLLDELIDSLVNSKVQDKADSAGLYQEEANVLKAFMRKHKVKIGSDWKAFVTRLMAVKSTVESAGMAVFGETRVNGDRHDVFIHLYSNVLIAESLEPFDNWPAGIGKSERKRFARELMAAHEDGAARTGGNMPKDTIMDRHNNLFGIDVYDYFSGKSHSEMIDIIKWYVNLGIFIPNYTTMSDSEKQRVVNLTMAPVYYVYKSSEQQALSSIPTPLFPDTRWGSGIGGGSRKYHVGDFNGDGMDDLMETYPGNGNAYVWLSTGNGFPSYTRWGGGIGGGSRTYHIGDFNGDGRDDLMELYPGNGNSYVWLSTGNGFPSYTRWGGGIGGGSRDYKVGDFNGDGKDDLMELYPGNGNIYVWLSTGNGFPRYTRWGSGIGGGSRTYRVGDFNGDGKDDLLELFPDNERAYVALSTGSSFSSFSIWGSSIIGGGARRYHVDDYNGDGKDDLVETYPDNNSMTIAYSEGNKFAIFHRKAIRIGSGSRLYYSGDFDGNGKSDLLETYAGNGNSYVWLSR